MQPAWLFELMADKKEVLRLIHQGELVNARSLCLKLCEGNTKNPDTWYLLADINSQIGDLNEVIRCCSRILVLRPDDLEAKYNLGVAYQALDEYKNAERVYKQILEHEPNNFKVMLNLGVIYWKLQHYQNSVDITRKFLASNPESPQGHNNLGLALMGLGHLDDALACFKETLRLQSGYSDVHYSLGICLSAMKRFEESEKYLLKATELNPKDVQSYFELARVYRNKGNTNAAIQALRRIIELDPNHAAAYNSLGVILGELNKLEESENALRKLIQILPDNPVAYNNLGTTLLSQGRIEEAENAFRQAIVLRPGYAEAIRQMTTCRKYSPNETEDIERIKKLLNCVDLTDNSEMHLQFALGKIYDDIAAYSDAFRHYHKGNILRHKYSQFNRFAHKDAIDRIINNFQKDFFTGKSDWGSDSEVPVFIIGMPRSGTTLVEQILSSHPEVSGGGELNKLGLMVDDLPRRLNTESQFPECIGNLDSTTAKVLAAEYLEHLNQSVTGAPSRITDKMPSNFHYLGLVAILFPKCRVIHCLRNAADTCISNYFQWFSHGNEHSFDLIDTVSYYKQYMRLMDHWRTTLPLSIFDIHYEDLTADTETHIRKLIDFVDLPWSGQCLRFHQQLRPVNTASVWQVRQPIYKRSVARWKNYRKDIGPLLDSLGIMNKDS